MRSRLQLDVRNLSLWRRHLANAYEVNALNAGIAVIAGNSVCSMPERLSSFTTRCYVNPLYLYLAIGYLYLWVGWSPWHDDEWSTVLMCVAWLRFQAPLNHWCSHWGQALVYRPGFGLEASLGLEAGLGLEAPRGQFLWLGLKSCTGNFSITFKRRKDNKIDNSYNNKLIIIIHV